MKKMQKNRKKNQNGNTVTENNRYSLGSLVNDTMLKASLGSFIYNSIYNSNNFFSNKNKIQIQIYIVRFSMLHDAQAKMCCLCVRIDQLFRILFYFKLDGLGQDLPKSVTQICVSEMHATHRTLPMHTPTCAS